MNTNSWLRAELRFTADQADLIRSELAQTVEIDRCSSMRERQ